MDLTASSQALQDKINQLLLGQSISPPKTSGTSPSRPSSVASLRSAFPDNDLQKDVLHSRLESLERENASLRDAVDAARADVALVKALESERDTALASVSSTENQLRTLERKLTERESKIESLERAALKTTSELERVKNENEARVTDLQAKLDASESLVKSLKEAIAVKEGVEHDRDALLKAKNDEIGLLEGRLEKVSGELEADRKELNAQIDELRQAGQETIALYEERLSTADSRRYELEDRVAFLEDQVKKASTPLSPSAVLQRATSAAEIDNENLREQVQHLQRRLATLEDSLEDAHAVSEREEAAVRERIKRFKDKEDVMRNELNEGRKTVEQVLKAEALAKSRVEEVEEALRESTFALENAQAEIENLRSDVAASGLLRTTSHLNLVHQVAGLETDGVPESQTLKADERTRLKEEIQELRDELNQLRSSAAEFASTSSTADDDTNWQTKYEQVQKEVLVLHKGLEERASELDTMKKRLNRDIPVNGVQEPPKTPTLPKQESAEIMGLKHIVQDLQQETSAVTQRNKLLESENRLLMSETDQLRQELKLLEENIEQSLLREEAALGTHNTLASGDEQMARLENELEQLRKRLAEAEMKTARVTHDLNKEIGELEALVESKIYREDELEQELERLKEKLSRNNKKLSKNGLEPTDLPPRKRSSTPNSFDRSSSEDVCEICERPGHDIFTCDLLRDDTTLARDQNAIKKTNGDPSDLFCVDCEGHGHVAADCPHSLDVF
jgi:chromosome segregation ATPase